MARRRHLERGSRPPDDDLNNISMRRWREADRAAQPHYLWILAMVIAVRRPAPTFLGYTPSLHNAAPEPYDASVVWRLSVFLLRLELSCVYS